MSFLHILDDQLETLKAESPRFGHPSFTQPPKSTPCPLTSKNTQHNNSRSQNNNRANLRDEESRKNNYALVCLRFQAKLQNMYSIMERVCITPSLSSALLMIKNQSSFNDQKSSLDTKSKSLIEMRIKLCLQKSLYSILKKQINMAYADAFTQIMSFCATPNYVYNFEQMISICSSPRQADQRESGDKKISSQQNLSRKKISKYNKLKESINQSEYRNDNTSSRLQKNSYKALKVLGSIHSGAQQVLESELLKENQNMDNVTNSAIHRLPLALQSFTEERVYHQTKREITQKDTAKQQYEFIRMMNDLLDKYETTQSSSARHDNSHTNNNNFFNNRQNFNSFCSSPEHIGNHESKKPVQQPKSQNELNKVVSLLSGDTNSKQMNMAQFSKGGRITNHSKNTTKKHSSNMPAHKK